MNMKGLLSGFQGAIDEFENDKKYQLLIQEIKCFGGGRHRRLGCDY